MVRTDNLGVAESRSSEDRQWSSANVSQSFVFCNLSLLMSCFRVQNDDDDDSERWFRLFVDEPMIDEWFIGLVNLSREVQE